MTWHIRIWSLNHDSVVTVEGLARIAEFRALAAADDVYAQLTAALAPSIWQLDDVKKGVLCQARSVVTRRVRWRSENQERMRMRPSESRVNALPQPGRAGVCVRIGAPQ